MRAGGFRKRYGIVADFYGDFSVRIGYDGDFYAKYIFCGIIGITVRIECLPVSFRPCRIFGSEAAA